MSIRRFSNRGVCGQTFPSSPLPPSFSLFVFLFFSPISSQFSRFQTAKNQERLAKQAVETVVSINLGQRTVEITERHANKQHNKKISNIGIFTKLTHNWKPLPMKNVLLPAC